MGVRVVLADRVDNVSLSFHLLVSNQHASPALPRCRCTRQEWRQGRIGGSASSCASWTAGGQRRSVAASCL